METNPMKYQTEHLEDLTQSQTLLSQLFTYIGENENSNKQLRNDYRPFMQAWAGENPIVRLKVFTARDEHNQIKGCVIALQVANPLFIDKPTFVRIVDLIHDDKGFDEYVKIILDSL